MKSLMQYVFIGALVVLIAAIGQVTYAAPQKEKTAPAKISPLDKSKSPDASLSGKVVETMNAGGYTYVCIEKNGKKTWVAVPEMKVAKGQQIAFQPGQEMKQFVSKSLNRTFDSIIFSGGPASQDAPGLPAGHEKVAQASPGSKSAVSPAEKNIKVEKASGPNSYTVGEIYAKRAALHSKPIVVKGKVVKVSAGIMGKNFIHLQDGTGDQAKSTHNLVVTSDELPAVGDVVTIKGTVFKDKDFGAGYKYTVILENAKIQK